MEMLIKPHDSAQKKTIFPRTHLLHIHALVVSLQSDASIIHISMQHRPIYPLYCHLLDISSYSLYELKNYSTFSDSCKSRL